MALNKYIFFLILMSENILPAHQIELIKATIEYKVLTSLAYLLSL